MLKIIMMQMPDNQKSLSLLVAVFFAGYLATVWFGIFPQSANAAIFPLVIGGLGMVLSIANFLVRSMGHRLGKEDLRHVPRKELMGLGWFVAFASLIILTGFYIGTGIATFLYLYIAGRLGILKSSIIALAIAVTEWLLLQKMLGILLPLGVLF